MKPYYETETGKLYCGDCLEIMPTIPDKSIDMILADLPYGTTACKWDTIIPFDKLWEQYKRIIKDNGVIILTASQPFTSLLVMSNIKWFKYEWIWNKVNGANFMNIKNRPFKTQEQVLVFSPSSNFTFNPKRVKRTEKSLKRNKEGIAFYREYKSVRVVEHYNNKYPNYIKLDADGKKHPIDIITFSIHENGRYKFRHPTKKPVALFKYLISTYSNKGDTVLDNVIGSGTTAVACEKLGRKFIGIELSEEYCRIAKARIENERQQLRLAL